MTLAPPLGSGWGRGGGELAPIGKGGEADMEVFMDETGTRLMCMWFVMCDRAAEWAAAGPDGDMMPVCQRCADRVGLAQDELYAYELTTGD